MRAGAAAVVSLVLLPGCAGAAGMVLKSPVVDRCRDAGLRGCDELADGVIAYVSGDKQEGTDKIVKGVAKNAPDDVREFAAKLKMLKDLPGVADYMGPIGEIVDMLAAGAQGSSQSKSVSSSSSSGTTTGDSPAPAPGATTRSSPYGARAGIVVPAVSSTSTCLLMSDSVFPVESGDGRCVELARGPLVLTDVQTTGACPAALGVLAGEPGSPRWMLYGPAGATLSVHGASYGLASGERLMAIEVGRVDAAKDVRCSITWAVQPN